MEKLCLFLTLAILSNQALGMSYRNRRQSEDGEENLEDRYGWNRPGWNRPSSNGPNRFPPRPWRPNPGQNQFPDQNQNQFPDQNQNQFPGQNQNQFPGQNQNQFPGQDQNQVQTSPSPSPNAATTQSPNVQECLRTCPVTSEYNPVCGTNNVTYDNPSRLFCAQSCGVNVSQSRATRCPATVAAN